MHETFQPRVALLLFFGMILLFAAMWFGLYLTILLPRGMTAF